MAKTLINDPESDLSYRKPPQAVLDASKEVQAFVATLQHDIEKSAKDTEKLEGALGEAKQSLKDAPDWEGLVKLDAGNMVVMSEDLSRYEEFDPKRWLFAETVNFRNDSGYSLNMFDRAKEAVKRAFQVPKTGDTIQIRKEFGSLGEGGVQTYDALPPFERSNRLLVIVGILGPAGE